MTKKSFFDKKTENSEVKSQIVTKYFGIWSKIMLPVAKKRGTPIAYIDLFAGPGRYDDGTESTPLKILKIAIKSPDLCQNLVTLFNDKEDKYSEKLKYEIGNITGIKKLKFQPKVMTIPVGKAFSDYFNQNNLVPTFSFIDPWGYKGLTLKIVKGVMKDWGCDAVLFFNYKRVNAAITNPNVKKNMIKLFGKEKLKKLRKKVKKTTNVKERKSIVLEAFSQALKDQGVNFVLPFQFENKNRKVSHHLIFISKHFLGYDIMKQIMAKESSSNSGEAVSFSYSIADKTVPLLYSLQRSVSELNELLVGEYKGECLSLGEIYENHSVDLPFLKKDYRKVLLEMEKNKEITVITSSDKPRRKGTLPEHCKIKFKV